MDKKQILYLCSCEPKFSFLEEKFRQATEYYW